MKQKSVFANVLVTAVGGIVEEGIVKSLKFAKMSDASPVSYKIFGVDMNDQAAGLYRCDYGILIPSASSDDYIESIKRIITEKDIRAVYVGSDIELHTLARAKIEIESKSNATVITNPADVIDTARDKWKTFQFLNKNHLPMAMSCLPEDKEEFFEKFDFPLVVKPREGYASLHFYIVHRDPVVPNFIGYRYQGISLAVFEPICALMSSAESWSQTRNVNKYKYATTDTVTICKTSLER